MANDVTDLNAVPEVTAGAPESPAESREKPIDEMTDDEALDAIFAFARQFPEPERGCNVADARWFEENFAELVRLYRGQIVVVYNRAVVTHGPVRDAYRLELAAARKLNVTPDCLTVELVYAPEL